MGLKHDVAEAQRQVEIRSAKLQRHIYEFRHSWRERINPRALVLVGAAVGVVLDQIIRFQSPRKRGKHRISKAAHALHLLPIAQLAVSKWLSQKAQSPRSTNFADHSITRSGNGLSRH